MEENRRKSMEEITLWCFVWLRFECALECTVGICVAYNNYLSASTHLYIEMYEIYLKMVAQIVLFSNWIIIFSHGYIRMWDWPTKCIYTINPCIYSSSYYYDDNDINNNYCSEKRWRKLQYKFSNVSLRNLLWALCLFDTKYMLHEVDCSLFLMEWKLMKYSYMKGTPSCYTQIATELNEQLENITTFTDRWGTFW